MLRRRHRRALSRDGYNGQLRSRRGADNAPPKRGARRYGKSTSSVRRTARAWASRWLTARNGLFAAQANPFAIVEPTIRPPIKPGPAAAATPSTSPRITPASASARDIKWIEVVEMSARGNLGHNTAIGHVLRELGVHQIGEDLRAGRRGGHHGGRALVAAGFDAENDHRAMPPLGRRGLRAPELTSRRSAGRRYLVGFEGLVGGGVDFQQLDGIAP